MRVLLEEETVRLGKGWVLRAESGVSILRSEVALPMLYYKHIAETS